MDVKEYFGKIVVVGTCEHQEFLDHPFLSGQYGEIEHINLKHDPMTGRSRGFAFVVFKVSTYRVIFLTGPPLDLLSVGR